MDNLNTEGPDGANTPTALDRGDDGKLSSITEAEEAKEMAPSVTPSTKGKI